jgi:hypothetical protein
MLRRVLSFDVGLRNLGAAVVVSRPGWTFPSTYVSVDETKDGFHTRAFADFLVHGWDLERWRVLDVTEALNRNVAVKNVKRLTIVTKTLALTDTLAELEAEWFPEDAPHTVVTEVQHNGNADMRAVCMGILVFFRRSMPDTILTAVSGSHKLKVCTALGVCEGDGLAAKAVRKPRVVKGATARKSFKTSASAAASASASVCKKSKYDDNKRRAILAVDVLLADRRSEHTDVLAAHAKKDDLADALLQAVWVLWTLCAPRAPVRPRAPRPLLSGKKRSRGVIEDDKAVIVTGGAGYGSASASGTVTGARTPLAVSDAVSDKDTVLKKRARVSPVTQSHSDVVDLTE